MSMSFCFKITLNLSLSPSTSTKFAWKKRIVIEQMKMIWNAAVLCGVCTGVGKWVKQTACQRGEDESLRQHERHHIYFSAASRFCSRFSFFHFFTQLHSTNYFPRNIQLLQDTIFEISSWIPGRLPTSCPTTTELFHPALPAQLAKLDNRTTSMTAAWPGNLRVIFKLESLL